MPARDVVWEPGMTLPEERMRGLAAELREGLGEIPRLTAPGASTDEVADAVWAWMGTRQPSPTWGWQIADPRDLSRAQSILSRDHVHWVAYDPQGLYGDPMVPTTVALLARELGPLPEDAQYEASPATDPDGWNWPKGETTARRVYRWRVHVSWRESRPHVKLEHLMQLQKLATIPKTVDQAWQIYNKGGQNQLYTFQPESSSWWSGADVSDWLDTHALEIADVIQGVAWAMISVATLGAGAGAAAGVTVVRIATDVLKKLAVAAETGAKVDVGQLFADLGAAGAALLQVPGVSDLVSEVGAWAEKAGQEVLQALPGNGVFTSLITSGGGFVKNLADEGAAIYSEAKGWYDRSSDVVAAVGKLGSVQAEAEAVITGAAPSEIQDAMGALFARLHAEVGPGKAFEAAKLELFAKASAELDRKLAGLRGEIAGARALLPAHLLPWFDMGRRGAVFPNEAPFYATSAVNYGKGAAELEEAVSADVLRAKNAADANLSFHDMISRYGLFERYRLFQKLGELEPRYHAQFQAEKAAYAAQVAAREKETARLKALDAAVGSHPWWEHF